MNEDEDVPIYNIYVDKGHPLFFLKLLLALIRLMLYLYNNYIYND